MNNQVLRARFARRGPAAIVARNLLDLVVVAGYRNWSRNLAGTIPAIASIALLALLAGLGAVIALALATVTAAQADQATTLQIYLRDDATQLEVTSLEEALRRDARVHSVSYVSKADALFRAERRPGMSQLLQASGSNPLPAGLDVRVQSLDDVPQVAASFSSAAGIDRDHPTSFQADTYGRLQVLVRTAAIAGGGLLLLLLAIAGAVTAGSIRSTLLARRAEVEVMWLVGSPPWMIRGPFLMEGALTGGAGAAVGGLMATALALAALHAQATAVSAFLPGVTDAVLGTLLFGLVGAGVGLGSMSALVGVRDLRR
ncbi:MAG: FtsX-like permease family protein [Chloroflexi bacterium]|nr:MAG: FtsX-like permease family protein [Chloroflexota bacterium]